MYALLGEIRSDVVDDSSETACLSASLSVQDLLRVGGASGRDGLQRTAPRRAKLERPRRALGFCSSGLMERSLAEMLGAETVGAALVQDVASSWAAITSSMLASPQGASEQYMWILTSERRVKGWIEGSEGRRGRR